MTQNFGIQKKSEILDLFANFSKLRSKKEFDEIEYDLSQAFELDNLEVIKIYLGETIENKSQDLRFKIDKKSRTASLFRVKNETQDLIVPRSVKYESVDYLITNIARTGANIKTMKFVEDSAVKTIHESAFKNSEIEEIFLPSSLTDLKDGWCSYTEKLRRIVVPNSNSNLKYVDDTYLVSKSDPNSDEFDVLQFVRRSVTKFVIPSNIRIISSCAFRLSSIKEIFIPSRITKIGKFAFFRCDSLIKVEIPADSKLQIIDKYSFYSLNIKEFSVPSNVSKICHHAFYYSEELECVNIQENSNLQIIKRASLQHLGIRKIFIPSKVTKIAESAFSDCYGLTEIQIPENSLLKTIGKKAFCCTNIKEIYFPSSLTELGEEWCNYT